MKDNLLYIKLKQKADTDEYTIEQAESVTKEQTAIIVGVELMSKDDGFFTNMKARLVQELKQAERVKRVEEIKQLLVPVYPKVVVEEHRAPLGQYPFAEIYYNGKGKMATEKEI